MQEFSISGPECPPELAIKSANYSHLAPGQSWSVQKRTLRSGLSTGVEVLEVDNGTMRVFLLPTRGMGIWKITQGMTRFGWDAPAENPVHPAYVNLKSRNGLGWLDGFNELLCRCGLAFNGPPGIDEAAASPIESDITLHGQIANRPAEWVTLQIDADGITIRGLTREMTLFGPNLALESTYHIDWNSSTLKLTDTVKNLASRPAEMQLLYHINIGTPILEAGSVWQAPIKEVYPRDPRAAEGSDEYQNYLGPTAGYAEQVYLCRLLADDDGVSVALLTNRDRSQGFGLRFDTRSLPCFSVWKNTQPVADGYCTGLEPATNYPNFKAVERKNGRVVCIPPGNSWSTKLSLMLLDSAESVSEIAQQIDRLQAGQAPLIFPSQAGLTD